MRRVLTLAGLAWLVATGARAQDISFGGSSPGGLAADPAACGANQWVTDIDKDGVLTCSQPAASNLSNGVNGTGAVVLATGNAGTASAFASNPTDCSSSQFATAIDASGNLTCASLTLAGAQFANQGTATQVLHGNAAGNPTWSAVSISADVSGLGTGVAAWLATPTFANLLSAVTGDTPLGAANSVASITGKGFTSFELGAGQTDTTVTRSAAGVMAVEGVNVLTTATGVGATSPTFLTSINATLNTNVTYAMTEAAGAVSSLWGGTALTGVTVGTSTSDPYVVRTNGTDRATWGATGGLTLTTSVIIPESGTITAAGGASSFLTLSEGSGSTLAYGTYSFLAGSSVAKIIQGSRVIGIDTTGPYISTAEGLTYRFDNGLVMRRPASAVTTTATTGYASSNTLYRSGDADGQTITLENNPPLAGTMVTVCVDQTQTSNNTAVVPSAGEDILDAGTTATTSCTATQVGACITLQNTTTGAGAHWLVVAKNGTWTCS